MGRYWGQWEDIEDNGKILGSMGRYWGQWEDIEENEDLDLPREVGTSLVWSYEYSFQLVSVSDPSIRITCIWFHNDRLHFI